MLHGDSATLIAEALHVAGICATQDERVVVLINCGATESIKDICGFSDSVRVIVIDSHRPVYHGHMQHHDLNRSGGVFVVLADDDPVPIAAIPEYIEAYEGEEDEEVSQGGLVWPSAMLQNWACSCTPACGYAVLPPAMVQARS